MGVWRLDTSDSVGDPAFTLNRAAVPSGPYASFSSMCDGECAALGGTWTLGVSVGCCTGATVSVRLSCGECGNGSLWNGIACQVHGHRNWPSVRRMQM